jgi:hypothetical protein
MSYRLSFKAKYSAVEAILNISVVDPIDDNECNSLLEIEINRVFGSDGYIKIEDVELKVCNNFSKLNKKLPEQKKNLIRIRL